MDSEHEFSLEAFARARVDPLLRFGYALTGDADRAADLVQEALLRTGIAWPRIRQREDVEGYVRQTIVRLNISWWRRTRRELLVAAVPDASSARHLADPGRDDGPAWTALRSLPPRQRTVLALRYLEDLDDKGIAAAMQCSVGTVKSQASRALATLRLRLADTTEELL